MTKTNPPAAHPAATATGAAAPVRSADILLNLVVILLAPIFLGAADGDVGLARLAAVETVNAYRAQNHADLLAVAQIIAFGFATLGSLCLSMADDLSLTMVLRLRGSANALSRSAEVHRRALARSHAGIAHLLPSDHPPAQADDPPAQPAVQAAISPASVPTPPSKIDDTPVLWAAALTQAAEQFTAELSDLSPAEQQLAALQAAALKACASDLLAEAGAERADPGRRQNASASQASSSDPQTKQPLTGSA